LTELEAANSDAGEPLPSSSATILRISGKASGAVRPNRKICRNVSGWFQIAASTALRMFGVGCRSAHSTSLATSLPSSVTSIGVSGCAGRRSAGSPVRRICGRCV
jgi:hypothetical protein